MKVFALDSISPQSRKLSRVSTLFAVPLLAIGLTMPGLVRADERGKTSPTATVAPKASKTAAKGKLNASSGEQMKADKILVTGSHIPRRPSRLSGPLDTTFPVYIIDSQQIRRSGATGVAGVLGTYGMRR